jgi:hypothetical protein
MEVRKMCKIQGIEYWMSETQRTEVKKWNWEHYGSIFGSPEWVRMQESQTGRMAVNIQKINPMIKIKVRC